MHNTDRLAGDFTAFERADLQSHPMGIPSPRESSWRSYICSRLRTLTRGMAVYATREYAQIRLTQYIDSTKAMDEIAKKITNNVPSVVHIGGAKMTPNSPIGMILIRFHVFHFSGNVTFDLFYSIESTDFVLFLFPFVQVSRKTSDVRAREN